MRKTPKTLSLALPGCVTAAEIRASLASIGDIVENISGSGQTTHLELTEGNVTLSGLDIETNYRFHNHFSIRNVDRDVRQLFPDSTDGLTFVTTESDDVEDSSRRDILKHIAQSFGGYLIDQTQGQSYTDTPLDELLYIPMKASLEDQMSPAEYAKIKAYNITGRNELVDSVISRFHRKPKELAKFANALKKYATAMNVEYENKATGPKR